MTAGLADDATAVKQSWHRVEQTIAYRLRKTDIRATHIPDGRESAIEARMQELRGMVRKIRHGRLCDACKVQAGEIDVDVSVNQAWHQHPTTAIDDFGIRGYGVRDGNYILDGCARDYNIVTFDEPVGFAVEDARSAKNNGLASLTVASLQFNGAVTYPDDCIWAISKILAEEATCRADSIALIVDDLEVSADGFN